MAQGICEAIWIKSILTDLDISCEGPVKLFCDNNLILKL